jgi:hypothetical protein
MTRYLKFATPIVGVWGVLYLLGGAVAWYYGADFSKPSAIKSHIATHLRYRTQARPDEVRPAIDVGIAYVCKGKVYGWNPRADAIFIDGAPQSKENAAQAGSMPPLIRDASLETFIAGLGVSSPRPLPSTLQRLAELQGQRGSTSATLVGGLTGFALGFWRGYASAPDCGSQAFEAVVGDKAFWRELSDRLPLTKGIGGARDGS